LVSCGLQESAPVGKLLCKFNERKLLNLDFYGNCARFLALTTAKTYIVVFQVMTSCRWLKLVATYFSATLRGCNERLFAEAMDQEDDGVGYIEEDHPLRPQAAAQSLALLQVPDKSSRSRNVSISSSVTDLDAPIYAREDARPSRRHVSTDS
jgi:hypothetical protein